MLEARLNKPYTNKRIERSSTTLNKTIWDETRKPMAKINQIQTALSEIDGGAFKTSRLYLLRKAINKSILLVCRWKQ
jgi:hypothetical protein